MWDLGTTSCLNLLIGDNTALSMLSANGTLSPSPEQTCIEHLNLSPICNKCISSRVIEADVRDVLVVTASASLRSSMSLRSIEVTSCWPKWSIYVEMSTSSRTGVSLNARGRVRMSASVLRVPFLYLMLKTNSLRRTRQRIRRPFGLKNSRMHRSHACLEYTEECPILIYCWRV